MEYSSVIVDKRAAAKDKFPLFATSLVHVIESGFLVVVVGVGVSFSVGDGIANFLSVGSSVNATSQRISSSNYSNESASKQAGIR